MQTGLYMQTNLSVSPFPATPADTAERIETNVDQEVLTYLINAWKSLIARTVRSTINVKASGHTLPKTTIDEPKQKHNTDLPGTIILAKTPLLKGGIFPLTDSGEAFLRETFGRSFVPCSGNVEEALSNILDFAPFAGHDPCTINRHAIDTYLGRINIIRQESAHDFPSHQQSPRECNPPLSLLYILTPQSKYTSLHA